MLNNRFSLMNLNIQSLNGHFQMLESVIQDIKIDILVLSEIWQAVPEYSKLQGYHEPTFKTRDKKRCGGTGIYIKDTITILENPTSLSMLHTNELEICYNTISIHSKPFIVIALYRAPNSNMKKAMKEFEKVIQTVTDLGYPYVLAGDTNIDTSKETAQSIQYMNIIQRFQSRQIVNNSTRITAHSSTCIDHIITNNLSMESIVTDFCPADHQAVLATWEVKVHKKDKKQKKKVIKSQSVNIEKTADKIRSIDWTDFLDLSSDQTISIHNLYSIFEQKISDAIVHEVKEMPSKMKNPWMTPQLLIDRNQVLSLRSRFLKSKTLHSENRFKTAKSEYNDALKEAKNNFYKSLLLKAGKDQKKIWQVISSILDRKKYKDVETNKIIYQGKELTDEKSIAQGFNCHFKNCAFEVAQQIHPKKHFMDFLKFTDKVDTKFSFKIAAENDIKNIIMNMKPKKSSGFDFLSSKILKSTSSSLIPPLTKMINKSLVIDHEFPHGLKLGKLQPLHKKGSVTDPNNFRPISQLSIVSNVFEKVAINQLNEHFKVNNVGYNCQFGFKKQHSCSHALMITRNFIETERSKKNYVILISTDQSKAFDTLNTESILPSKLKYYGMNDDSLHWINSFFHERHQYTKWNEANSDIIKLHNISCVQGSSMGPWTFNIYVNDLSGCTQFFCVQFADDTNLLISGPNLDELIEKANLEIDKVLDYMDANYLSVNIKKCNFMIFKPKIRDSPTNHILKIRDIEITETDCMKFLGIFLDNKLSFKKQISHVMSKMKSAIGALIKTRHSLTFRSKVMLYNSLVKPHLDYCCLVWLDKANKGQKHQLYVLQKRAIRICFNASYNSHSAQLFKISNIIPLENLYEREATIFIKKFQNHELPSVFHDKLGTFLTDVRAKFMYTMKIPAHYKNGHMFYSIMNQWNKINIEFRKPSKTEATKSNMKESILDELNKRVCKIPDTCYMCQRDKHKQFDKYAKM